MATKENDAKVFDVAKPTDAKKDIGSKPMIIGHKSLKEDPMVKEAVTESGKEETPTETAGQKTEEQKVTPPSVSKKVITPPSEEQKKEVVTKDTVVATDSQEGSTEENIETEEIEEELKVDPEVEKNEKNEKLHNMIESKKYFVTIHEKSSSHAKVFIITFIIALLVGFAVVALLIDAEVLDLGVDVPFDFL